MRVQLTLLSILFTLLAAGCNADPGAAMFARLLASDNGVGATLGTSRATSTAKLGQPFQRTSKLDGKVVEENFLPSGTTAYDADAPQLTLDYYNDQLTHLLNLYRPFDTDPTPPDPPFKLHVLPGVGLGNRKSDFDAKLGKPNFGALKDQWRFVAKDGRSISVQAVFTTNPTTNDPICTRLDITLAPKVAEQRGEQYEGKK